MVFSFTRRRVSFLQPVIVCSGLAAAGKPTAFRDGARRSADSPPQRRRWHYRHFLEQWEGDEAGRGLPVLLRGIFVGQAFPSIAKAGRPPEAAALRAGLVAGQLLGLAIARYVVRLPPVVAMPADLIPHRWRNNSALRDSAAGLIATGTR